MMHMHLPSLFSSSSTAFPAAPISARASSAAASAAASTFARRAASGSVAFSSFPAAVRWEMPPAACCSMYALPSPSSSALRSLLRATRALLICSGSVSVVQSAVPPFGSGTRCSPAKWPLLPSLRPGSFLFRKSTNSRNERPRTESDSFSAPFLSTTSCTTPKSSTELFFLSMSTESRTPSVIAFESVGTG
eukprot:scaffold5358_cov68-Phaeocystis_antarctica.AAC.7